MPALHKNKLPGWGTHTNPDMVREGCLPPTEGGHWEAFCPLCRTRGSLGTVDSERQTLEGRRLDLFVFTGQACRKCLSDEWVRQGGGPQGLGGGEVGEGVHTGATTREGTGAAEVGKASYSV